MRRERAAEVRLGEAMRAEIELCGAPMCAAPLDPFLIELSQGVPKQRRVPIGDGVQPSREERATPHYDDEHEAGEWMPAEALYGTSVHEPSAAANRLRRARGMKMSTSRNLLST
mgnify:CR=1 FL=1